MEGHVSASKKPRQPARGGKRDKQPRNGKRERRARRGSYEIKIAERFATFDRNHDGAISRLDLEFMADGILRALRQNPRSPKGRALIEGARLYFDGLARSAKADPDGPIDRAAFLAAAQQSLHAGLRGFDDSLRPWAEAVIAVADHDDDGRVSVDVWTQVLTAMGANQRQASASARGLDTDRDGHISTRALLAEARRFYVSDEPVEVFSAR
ncbi:EF-hand domain-containing protein [Actinomadura logoneensis]|uniref:EF-hand domain-containing protein n=1 Tax=Actinomadura logoneensis TaxID=2293572 RepID=A0A372JC62_9ACTN|nr:EF-hand domain-containing protein [Actinomadura logoneensis]RFU37603.1 EF-hand domain-containing protein [Actinomadura logoneensis]